MTPEIADKIHAALSQYPKRTYPKGQILVFADESPEHIFYLVSGKVRKYDVSYRGEEVVVNLFKPPSFFPMSWAINRDPNHFFYKTETETELHIVPADAAVTFLRDNPDVMYDLLARIYKGTEGLLGRLVHLMSGTAQSRLMYELILEGRRFGQAEQDGSVVLAINEGDLAARTGLSRETVSREVSKLKDRNLVTIAPKNLRILDMAALEQALGGEV